MTKTEFLSQLAQRLGSLPQAERSERLGFYSEMIDDRIEEGLTEEEAVRQIGSVDEAARQVLAEAAAAQPEQSAAPVKKGPGAGVIVLLVLSFPLWFPLLISAAAVLFSLIVTLWSTEVSLAAGAVGSVIAAVYHFIQTSWPTGFAALGAGMLLAGLSIFLFFGCKAATIGIFRLIKLCIKGIGSLFGRKGGVNEKNS